MRKTPKSANQTDAAEAPPAAEPLVQLPPLNVKAVTLLLEGLGKLPTERSGEMFFWLKHEAERQLNAPQPPADPAQRRKP